nr:RNA-directed DNA polymerase, eukaryota [Tanacetum cinerariifolium]
MRHNTRSSKLALLSDLADVDQIIDKGNVSADIINKRLEIIKSLQELNSHKSMEIAQKAKIKWAIEGDENSKYFHGILNKQRSRSAIRGVLVSGFGLTIPNCSQQTDMEADVTKEIKRLCGNVGAISHQDQMVSLLDFTSTSGT